MSWNLFEKIINALRPNKQESEQAPEASQSLPESGTEQHEASQEPSPDFQETAATQQSEWQD